MDQDVVVKSAIIGEKEEHRKTLRELPFPEKVRIVVQLQKIAAPVLKARGINVHPWKI